MAQQAKKKVVVFCSRPPQIVKLSIFTSQACSDGKEMYKKRGARAKLFFANLNLLLFCRARCCCRRRSLNSKVSSSLTCNKAALAYHRSFFKHLKRKGANVCSILSRDVKCYFQMEGSSSHHHTWFAYSDSASGSTHA